MTVSRTSAIAVAHRLPVTQRPTGERYAFRVIAPRIGTCDGRASRVDQPRPGGLPMTDRGSTNDYHLTNHDEAVRHIAKLVDRQMAEPGSAD